MRFEWKTWLITLLMLVAMLMYVQPAWGRGGGGGSGGRGGGGGGEGGFRGGSSMRASSGSGSFRGNSREFSSGQSRMSFDRSFRGERGGEDRFIASSRDVRGSGDRFIASSRDVRGGGDRFITSSRDGRDGGDRFIAGNRGGRDGGDHIAFRNRRDIFRNDFAFRRGSFNTSPSFLGNRFRNNNLGSVFGFHDSRFFHDRFFFNPFFHHRRFFFFNPFFTDFSLGFNFFSPYYCYGYDYPPYGYGAAPNYNTYNYYSSPAPETPTYGTSTPDQGTYARPAEQTGTPASPATADAYFDEGVKAFGSGDYAAATMKFAGAMKLAPQDKVLPFAYAQAVFAGGNYTEAVIALRGALAKVTPETEGVFYPRGLYSSDDILVKQIKTLSNVAEINSQNSNLQLLLGYHQFGMGDMDKAEASLKLASTDAVNGPPANALLKMIDKLRAAEAQTPKTETPPATPKEETPVVDSTSSPQVKTPAN